jgi:DNA polymerase-3 subunit delta
MATFEEILKDFKSNTYQNCYVFYGEEPYFIDTLIDLAIDKCIPNEEKSFCQKVLYGPDTTFNDIRNTCLTTPMSFSSNPKQLVVVKNAKEAKGDLETLIHYLKHPSPSTILILSYRGHKEIDKKFPKNIVYFKSDKIKERDMEVWVKKQLSALKLSASSKVIQLIIDQLGNNIESIINELGKLRLTLAQDKSELTEEMILSSLSIQKEFTIYDFTDKLVERNHKAVFTIIEFYFKNPKNMNLFAALSSIFNTYLFLYRIKIAMREQSFENALSLAGITANDHWKYKKYKMPLAGYTIPQLERILDTFTEFNLRTIGVEFAGSNIEHYEAFKEFSLKIMSR